MKAMNTYNNIKKYEGHKTELMYAYNLSHLNGQRKDNFEKT